MNIIKALPGIICLITISFILRAERQPDSFESKLLMEIISDPQASDSVRINAYLDLAWELKSSQPGVAMQNAQKGIDLAEALKEESLLAKGLAIMGVIYRQNGNFPVAMDYQHEAYSIYSRLNDGLGQARTLGNMGLIFFNQGQYEKALDYFFQAVRLHEKQNNLEGIAPVLNNIGRAYQYQKNYKLAEAYHLRSLNIKKELNDQKGISYSLNSLGAISIEAGNYELALEYYKQALAIRENLPDLRELASSLRETGQLYLLMDSLDRSATYLQRAIRIYTQLGDQWGVAQSNNYLAEAYIRRGNLNRGQQLLENSLETSRRMGLAPLTMENYRALASLAVKRNNYREAYNLQEKLIRMRDSVAQHESQRRVGELQMMYEHERKEQEERLRLKNEEIYSLNFEKQRIQMNFLLGGVILVLALLFLLYNRYLAITHTNKKLEKQKNEISETNQKLLLLNKNLMEQKQKVEELNQKLNEANHKLLESEKHLINTNRTKDKFFSIISHDLRNPFASIVSFSRILKREIHELTKDELRELALELDKSVLKINNLLENLLQWSRAQTGKINYHPEYIALKAIVLENINLFSGNAREKNIEILDLIDEDLVVFADMNMTHTVVRNLLSNALKYTNPGGKIELNSMMEENQVVISVADNGVGISEENIAKLFRVDTLHTTFGTGDEKGSGLGLLLCKEFIEKQGGEISLESTEGEGTVFRFSLPLENPL